MLGPEYKGSSLEAGAAIMRNHTRHQRATEEDSRRDPADRSYSTSDRTLDGASECEVDRWQQLKMVVVVDVKLRSVTKIDLEKKVASRRRAAGRVASVGNQLFRKW